MKHQQLVEVLDWVGHPEPPNLMESLEQFEGWLREEGVVGGGVGPQETDLWVRHVLDSLMFARGSESPPSTIIDLGSGVGLPGLPLSLLFPAATVTLVDRSGRRAGLARRAVRVLGVSNVQIIRSDLARFEGAGELVVMRAVLRPKRALGTLRKHIQPGGAGVLGVGIARSPDLPGVQERFPGSEVLDVGRWLHIMRE